MLVEADLVTVTLLLAPELGAPIGRAKLDVTMRSCAPQVQCISTTTIAMP